MIFNIIESQEFGSGKKKLTKLFAFTDMETGSKQVRLVAQDYRLGIVQLGLFSRKAALNCFLMTAYPVKVFFKEKKISS